MPAKTRRFAPRLECLDARDLPSVSYDLQGTLLFVHGDVTAADTITITDNGTATGVSVTGGGGHDWAAGAVISHVFVDTQGGADTVTYNLTAPLSVNRLVDVSLGAGNDVYVANISNTTLAPFVNLDLSVKADGGKDSMTLNAQNVSTTTGSILNVDFAGQAGKDTMAFNYSIGVSGEFGQVIFTKDQKH